MQQVSSQVEIMQTNARAAWMEYDKIENQVKQILEERKKIALSLIKNSGNEDVKQESIAYMNDFLMKLLAIPNVPPYTGEQTSIRKEAKIGPDRWMGMGLHYQEPLPEFRKSFTGIDDSLQASTVKVPVMEPLENYG
jgi:hypothetical protein